MYLNFSRNGTTVPSPGIDLPGLMMTGYYRKGGDSIGTFYRVCTKTMETDIKTGLRRYVYRGTIKPVYSIDIANKLLHDLSEKSGEMLVVREVYTE